MRRILLPLLLLLTGCSTLGPALHDMDARQFHSVPEKSVIYVVREAPDLDRRPTVITLNAATEGLTYPGAFVRWVVAPGTHRIEGYGGDTGAIDLPTAPGGVYFVRQSVSQRDNLPQSTFTRVTEEDARIAVTRAARVNAS
jgi:hypothetical protein